MRSGGLPIVCLLSACSILSGPDTLIVARPAPDAGAVTVQISRCSRA